MAKNCANTNIYSSVDWCQGIPVVGGVQSRLYAISKRDIVKWPTRVLTPASATDVEKIVKYEGEFTLAADAKWFGIDVLAKKTNIGSKSEGETPNVISLNTATLFHPGNKAAVSAFVQQGQNDDLVFAVQEKTGEWRIIGAKQWETTFSYEQVSSEEELSTTITIEAKDFGPSPFFTGTLVTTDGDIDCATEDGGVSGSSSGSGSSGSSGGLDE